MLSIDPKALLRLMILRRLNCLSLGRAAQLAPSTISRLSRHGGNVKLDTLIKLTDALNVEYNQIVTEEIFND